jgi:hypothetical protein
VDWYLLTNYHVPFSIATRPTKYLLLILPPLLLLFVSVVVYLRHLGSQGLHHRRQQQFGLLAAPPFDRTYIVISNVSIVSIDD